MNQGKSGPGDGQSAFAKASPIRDRARLIVFLALLGSATYSVTLATTVPASLVASQLKLPEQIIDVSGTVWNGQAILNGGYELKWQVLPLHSLFHFAFDADWTLSGVDTRLTGRASLWTRAASFSADGRAGWGLVRMAAPTLALSCDGSVAIDLSRVVVDERLQGASGSLRSGPSVCTDASVDQAARIEVPPLTVTATMRTDESRLSVVATAAPGTPLAELKIARRILAATLFPEGARLVKSLPTSGPLSIEYPF